MNRPRSQSHSGSFPGLVEADKRARNASGVIANSTQARHNELAQMQNTGLVRNRTRDLLATRFEHTHAQTVPLFSMQTGSATHNTRTREVSNILMGRMFNNAQEAHRMHSQYGVDPMQTIRGGSSARLTVGYNPVQAPHYAHQTNSISLMNVSANGPFGHADFLNQAGHELQHAHDHLSRALDLELPRHRLASELNAFTQQNAIAQETLHQGPHSFEGHTPLQMAQSYHGKNGYPGTVTDSVQRVAAWKLQNP